MSRLRDTAAAACGVLCVAGLVVGLGYHHVARTLFDPAVFADRAAASLARPAVAEVIATQATDQIIAHRRDLTAYRPLLLGTLEYVVASAPVRAVVRRTARLAHARLISDAGDDILLTIEDLGVVARNALAAYPEVAARIPDGAEVVLGTVQDWPWVDRLLAAMRLGDRLRAGSAVGLGLGLLCGAGGVLLARRKHRFLLRLGLGLTLAALAGAAVARFGGGPAARLVDTPLQADLVRGAWPVFVGPLAVPLLLLAGLGIVLVAAVTSLLERFEPAAVVRNTVASTVRRRLAPGWSLLRGAALIAAGVLVLLHPQAVVTLLAVVAGAVLLYEGVQELFVTAVRLAPRVEASVARTPREDHASSRAGPIAVGVLAAVLIAGGALLLARDDRDRRAAADDAAACNGHPELCARPLNEVVFAATHNAMAAADIPDWMFPNQERGLRAQLADGVRGFLIDVHRGVPVGGRVKTLLANEAAARAKYEASLGAAGVDAALRIRDRLVGREEGEPDVYLAHGFCELGATRFVDWLRSLRDFLVAHPGEVVIVVVQDEGVAPVEVARCVEESGLLDLVYRGPVTAPWPTLGEMVERDERVVVFAENDARGVPWYHPTIGHVQETPYGFATPGEFSCAPNRGGTEGSLLLLNHWIETGATPNPANAEVVNAHDALLARARTCQQERGMVPNLVAVDFYRTGDLLRVVDELNGVGAALRP